MMANPILDKITSLNREVEQLRVENNHLRANLDLLLSLWSGASRDKHDAAEEITRLRARVE